MENKQIYVDKFTHRSIKAQASKRGISMKEMLYNDYCGKGGDDA